jgi:peptidoglycan hydrolase-like protein with peptidoglycan-binding domain
VSLPLPHSLPFRERRVARTVGAISASVIVLPFVGGTAEAAAPPMPKPSQPLPSALDVLTPYQKGTRCLTETQPGVLAFAKLLNATYGKHAYGTLRTCAAEHGEGRALDWMLDAKDPEQLALGNALTRWLSAEDSAGRPGAMARRLGINYIIWNRQQWFAWDPDMAWKPYYGSSPHTDHIHFSFTWDGAYARTSWWTGRALTRYTTGPSSSTSSTPSVTSSGYPYLTQGSTGSDVVTLQKVIGAEPDGRFGPLTAAALGTWQSKNGVKATKAADEATWAKMVALGAVPAKGSSSSGSSKSGSSTTSTTDLSRYRSTTLRRGSSGTAVKVLQKAIGGLAVDGAFGPRTEARVKAYQKSKGLTQNGVVDARVWDSLMGKGVSSSGGSSSTSPLAKYANVTLRLWSKGSAVKAMQKAIGGLAVDGVFGPKTQARVEAYQRSKGLAVTGVVDSRTWKALMGGSSTTSSSKSSSSSSGATSSTSPLAKYANVTLRLWSKGSAVKAMQKAVGGLAVDGVFGPKTQARVEAYQRSKGLAVTGVVDSRTWKALMGGSASSSSSASTSASRSSSSSAGSSSLSAYRSTTLRRGSSGAAVKALQKALGGLSVDGAFGPLTEARVKAFQKSAGLARTGVVDRSTWDALGRTSDPTQQYWGVVLKRGSTGTAVKALQKALGGLSVDGVFGPVTEARVKAFQKSAGLARTGVVGTVTWKALAAR